NSKARPDQFRELLTGLEKLKPGLGKALQARLGGILVPDQSLAIYNRHGGLDQLFDGTDHYPSY
ncbi:MAG: hypothetical protein HY925_12810, partial [Elusimicrobia bacterium]|nr:hypothetical protein [Elusimicrobiota bacterium]